MITCCTDGCMGMVRWVVWWPGKSPNFYACANQKHMDSAAISWRNVHKTTRHASLPIDGPDPVEAAHTVVDDIRKALR